LSHEGNHPNKQPNCHFTRFDWLQQNCRPCWLCFLKIIDRDKLIPQ
jgi:hypothetical protein